MNTTSYNFRRADNNEVAGNDDENDEIDGERIYGCCICNGKFVNETDRDDHFKTVHDDQMIMEISFEAKDESYELASITPPPKRQQQSLPPSQTQLSALKSLQPPPTPPQKNVESVMEQCRFCCNTCGKTFTKRQLFDRHQVVHTDHRPFGCSICPARFKVLL